MISAAILAACSGGDIPPPAAGLLDQSWVATVVADPPAFAAVVNVDREGWVALHNGDWLAAADRPGPVGHRAAERLAAFHTTLAAVQSETWALIGLEWGRNGGPPAGSGIANYVSAATGGTTFVAESALFQERSAWHARPPVRGDIPTLRTHGLSPLDIEGTGAAARDLYDPWVHAGLAAAWGVGVERPEGLAGDLFGPVRQADLREPLSTMVANIQTGADGSEACREVVRALDVEVDAFTVKAAATASNDGKALLTDLRLGEVARARTLEAIATSALAADRPVCALAVIELARDHGDPRAINPVNSPVLFALLAEANLRTGRVREALDALQPLEDSFPEVRGLDETVGDLAILTGLHRAGDSREN